MSESQGRAWPSLALIWGSVGTRFWAWAPSKSTRRLVPNDPRNGQNAFRGCPVSSTNGSSCRNCASPRPGFGPKMSHLGHGRPVVVHGCLKCIPGGVDADEINARDGPRPDQNLGFRCTPRCLGSSFKGINYPREDRDALNVHERGLSMFMGLTAIS